MDLYEMKVDNELLDGVFAISLVESPAILTDFVLLKKEESVVINLEVQTKVQDTKRKVLCGPVLIPDMIIPRKEFNIKFSKETIRKISEGFIINNNKDNVTLDHTTNVNGIHLIESWIVEDNKNDKSSYLGFNVPNGTWMASYKVQDDNLWSQVLSTGVFKGFSIEGKFSHEKVMMVKYDRLEKDIIQIYLAVKYSKYDLEEKFVWRTSTNDKKCPSCMSFNGKIKKLSEWIKTAIPGVPENMSIAGQLTSYPHSPFGTYCEGACQCTLNKIVTQRSKLPSAIEYK